jgi:hypothetical protein
MAEHGFWNHAQREPGALALVDAEGHTRTRGELLAACNRIVHGLRALGPRAREQMDEYLRRYLNFLGPELTEKLLPTVQVTSEVRLRDTLRALRDVGADEATLVPTTLDPDEAERVADVFAGL